MRIRLENRNGIDIAVVESDEVILSDPQAALDFLMTTYHQSGCNRIVVTKNAVAEEFFQLSSRLAGEILQKFINYRSKLAIVGDFSIYDSKSLRDFIYESNRGQDVFFAESEEEALRLLSQAR